MSASARRASVRELDARLGAARRIAELETVLRITLAENRKLSATDDLTRVASRRFFSKHFPREMERAARYGRGLSLVLCDIDFFKKLNDTSATPAATRSCDSSARGCSRICDAASTGWRASAARSSPSCCRRPHTSRRWKSRASCARPSPRRPSLAISKSVEVTASFGLCGLDHVPAGERQLAQRHPQDRRRCALSAANTAAATASPQPCSAALPSSSRVPRRNSRWRKRAHANASSCSGSAFACCTRLCPHSYAQILWITAARW